MFRYLPNSFLIEFSTGCEILPLAGNLEIDASDGDVTDPEMWLGTVFLEGSQVKDGVVLGGSWDKSTL